MTFPNVMIVLVLLAALYYGVVRRDRDTAVMCIFAAIGLGAVIYVGQL